MGAVGRWVSAVRLGDVAGLIGPDARYTGDHGGIEFKPASTGGPVLLAGDETAVPAVASILERLPADAHGDVVLEVPLPEDTLTLSGPPGVGVTWAPRRGAAHGSRLRPAFEEAAARLLSGPIARQGCVRTEEATPPANGVIWDVPDGPAGGEGQVYAWLAGEAELVRSLRRHLVNEHAVDRACVAAMGYWRRGRSEDGA